MPITLCSTSNGRISSPADVDWFQLTITTPGILTLGLTFSELDWTVLGAPDMKLMRR